MNSQSEATLNHFSHPHPLQLTNYHPNSLNSYCSAACSGCSLQVSGTIYSCKTCNYFLHTDCAKMPKKITHPFDKGHVLTLHSKPPYEEGLDVYCNACGKSGMKEFCYHCKICQIDLHVLCAVMPLTFTHPSHPHQLNLIFSPPHLDKSFICDVCKNLGSDHWLYRCDACDFDVHLNCRNVPVTQTIKPASMYQQNPATFRAFTNQYPPQQSGFAFSRSAPQVPPHQHQQYSQPVYQTPNVPTGIPMNHTYQGIDQAAVMAYLTRLEQELASVHHRMNQQQLQSLHHLQSFTAAGRFGGGRTGGGGLGGMHSLIDALTNGAGNGIGGNIPGLDLFGNGGGGGFGGLDLQNLVGGGFGNLDFGSFLGGGFGLF